MLDSWKKKWYMKVTVMPIIVGVLATVTKGLVQGLDDLEILGRVESIQNCCIIEIGQNTKKSPGDLRRLTVTPLSNGKPSANAGRKNSQMSKIIIIIIKRAKVKKNVSWRTEIFVVEMSYSHPSITWQELFGQKSV